MEDSKTNDWDARYKQWKAEKDKKKREDQGKIENNPSFIRKDIEKAEKFVEKEAKAVEKEVKREVYVIKEELKTPRARKIEKTIITVIYILVLGSLIYLLLGSLFPGKLPFSGNSYEITADSAKIFNPLSSFYIDDSSVLGKMSTINNENLRQIVSAKPFNLIFKPKENIKSKNATLELNFIFNETNFTSIYLNDKLIFPNLDSYSLVYESENDYVFANNNIKGYYDPSSFEKSNSAEEFVYLNFPSSSVWSTRPLKPIDVTLEDYNNSITDINTTFRDSLYLAVYAENNLVINFTKQDLNWNVGRDEYNITIRDLNKNIVYSNVFEDDGDATDDYKLGKEQNFEITIPIQSKGIYFIDFQRDKNNKWEDSTLKNVRINTNKILIRRVILAWSNFDFYTQTRGNSSIEMRFYWGDNRKVKVDGKEISYMNLTKTATYYYLNLTTGQYQISNNQSGQIWITFDNPLSLSKENWFDIPPILDANPNNQNLLILSKKDYNNELRSFKFKGNVTTDTNVKLMALDKDMAYFESAKLSLN